MARPQILRLLFIGLAGLILAPVYLTSLGGGDLPARLPAADYTPRPKSEPDVKLSNEARDALWRRAQVWEEPPQPIERADFSANPFDLEEAQEDGRLVCKFLVDDQGGTSPKFDCVLPGGEVIRVKYGDHSEVHAEVAATRLLRALGFGADQVSMFRAVRCFGCPRAPFFTLKAVYGLNSESLFAKAIDFDRYLDFPWAAVERRAPGREISSEREKGWGWYELSHIHPEAGGAPAAHVDALRLIAVFLSHWDNKSENQRFVCRSGDPATCDRPLAFIQDAGATFGPPKVNLLRWRETPIWENTAQCHVTMEGLPHEGATFPAGPISEAGRKFLADRLVRISTEQIRDLFLAGRFPQHRFQASPGHDVNNWVRTFQDKVRQIADRAPCPN